MPTYINSTNMSLPIPIVGTAPGPDYADDVNASLTILDAHDHSSGSGVQITPSGLDINDTLDMQTHNLDNIKNLLFTAQTSSSETAALYVIGVDLYYNDGSGNVVRITQSGSVSGASGTITGLPSGTASASFAAGTFTFNAATSTPANIVGASFILGNNTASTKTLTLAPPNAMAADYTVTLPALPAQTNLLTMTSGGTMSSVTWNAAASNVTRVGQTTTATALNIAESTSISGSYTGTYSSPACLFSSITLTTTGRPVILVLSAYPNGTSGNESSIYITNTLSNGVIRLQNTTTSNIVDYEIGIPSNSTRSSGTYILMDTSVGGTPGTYSYQFFAFAKTNAGTTMNVANYRFSAYEL